MRSSLVLIAALALGACAVDDQDDDADCNDTDTCIAEEALTSATPPFTLDDVRATRYPILLHHGFNASRTNAWSYHRVAKALEADGHLVVTTEVEPFAGVPTRAKRLARFVDDAIDQRCASVAAPERASCRADTKVNLVAHSMGGLDARYLASSLGYGDKIASITTISSPHGGSAVADAALGLLPGKGLVPDAIDALAGLFGRTFTARELTEGTDVHGAFVSLSEENAPTFNAQNRDVPSVYYQSYAGVSRAIGGPRTKRAQADVLAACGGTYFGSIERADHMDVSLVAGSLFVGRFTGAPQDGMVRVDRAKWGTFRGCFPADHLDEVGQPKHTGPDRYTGFDHVVFFRNLASDLARRGF